MSHILPLTAVEVERRLLKVADLAAHETVHEPTVSGDTIVLLLDHSIEHGSDIKFKAPVSCEVVSILQIQYKTTAEESIIKNFAFADANGNNVGKVANLFAKDAIVKVILDFDANIDGQGTGAAFVQNADTSKYLEDKFVNISKDFEDRFLELLASKSSITICTWEAND